MTHEIHLIHFTHHDFGYTDDPDTAEKLFSEYHRLALDAVEQTRDYPDAARFRWTCEVFEPTRRFFAEADASQRRRFERAIEAGQIEVAALPHHLTGLSRTTGLHHLLHEAGDDLKRWGAKTAMQIDVNGISWGVLPPLIDLGLEFVWLSANPYSGKPYGHPIRMLQWTGPDGRWVWLYIAPNYNVGYTWFHDSNWRRGPVPDAFDPFFDRPQAGDIFRTDADSLKQAHDVLTRRLEQLHDQAPPIIALPITNQWRFDNDPPFLPLSDFVRAWNEAGFSPSLRLSTPAQYLAALKEQVSAQSLPQVQGDWTDWWTDGPVAHSDLAAMVHQATDRLEVLPALSEKLGVEASRVQPLLDQGKATAARFGEHTFGAYESVPQPHTARSIANTATMMHLATSTDRLARQARHTIVTQSPHCTRFRDNRTVGVFNPNDQPRAGYVEVPGQLFAPGRYALQSETTGETYPLQPITGPEMPEKAGQGSPTEFTVPDDEWGFTMTGLRGVVPPIAANSIERFRIIEEESDRKAEDPIKVLQLNDEGRLVALGDGESMPSLLPDDVEDFAFPVIQSGRKPYARYQLLERDPVTTEEVLQTEPAQLSTVEILTEPGVTVVRRLWKHEAVFGVEQRLSVFHWEPRLEITTHFWLKDLLYPVAIYLALPCRGDGQSLRYGALGWPTRPGKDQLPESAAELIATDGRIEFAPQDNWLVDLHISQTPLVALDEIATRTGRVAFVPQTCHVYPLIHASLWTTNFPATSRQKVSVQHVMAWHGDAERDPDSLRKDYDLTVFPG